MSVPTTHIFDVLSGTKLTSLLLLEEIIPKSSHQFIWPTLLKRLCNKHTILLVRTEMPGSKPTYVLPPSVEEISLWDFESISEFFKALDNKILSSRSWVLFIEGLDGFLELCPSERNICDWSRLISSYLYSISTNPSVASVICTLNLYTDNDGELTCNSEGVSKIFESFATIWLRLSSSCRPTQVNASFWHRKTLDSVFKSIRLYPEAAPTNKPSVSGRFCLKLDCPGGMVVSCQLIGREVEKPAEEIIPTSSFKLTITDEEMKAKQKVVLPYTSAINAPIAADMKINYEMDEFDDFDEEDPDDDLDI